MSIEPVKAPFPWFGGKRRVADLVWNALGDVNNYVEPFAGSLAVLLGRPHPPQHNRVETVNDADSYLANVWRAIQADPEGLADATWWPVNETDLFARHAWLVNAGRERIANLEADPEFYDLKVAAWWLWGINSWIGSGWCSGNGPHRPHLGNAGQGVNRQLPHLGNAGRGVNREANQQAFTHYIQQIADRLDRVRVCCGDWSRVVTSGALSYGNTVGVFLDPPYLGEVRTKDLYAVDDHYISHDVREWCIQNGNDPQLRIVLAGYVQEHAHEMAEAGWEIHTYSANKAYGTSNTGKGNDINRHNEALWYSPHCVKPDTQTSLFGY